MHLRDIQHLSLRIWFVRCWCCRLYQSLFCSIVPLQAQWAFTRVRGSESGPIPALLCLIMRPIYWIIIGTIGGPAVNYCPRFYYERRQRCEGYIVHRHVQTLGVMVRYCCVKTDCDQEWSICHLLLVWCKCNLYNIFRWLSLHWKMFSVLYSNFAFILSW